MEGKGEWQSQNSPRQPLLETRDAATRGHLSGPKSQELYRSYALIRWCLISALGLLLRGYSVATYTFPEGLLCGSIILRCPYKFKPRYGNLCFVP